MAGNSGNLPQVPQKCGGLPTPPADEGGTHALSVSHQTAPLSPRPLSHHIWHYRLLSALPTSFLELTVADFHDKLQTRLEQA